MLRNERGSILVPTVVILMALTIMGMCLLRMVDLNLMMVNNDYLGKKAFYAAESGTQVALANIPVWEEDSYTFLNTEWEGVVEYTAPPEPNNPHPTTAEATVWHKVGEDDDGNPQIIYWGDLPNDGVFLYKENMEGIGHPVEYISSHGEAGAPNRRANRDIETSWVRESLFFQPNAPLYVNGDLENNGSPQTADGSGGGVCGDIGVMDIVTTDDADPDHQAGDWTGEWGDDGPQYNEHGTPYPVFNLANILVHRPNAIVIDPNNMTGLFDDCSALYVWEGNLEPPNQANNLSGCGMLVVTGNAVFGGNIQWNGIIMVVGNITFNGGGSQQITGSVIAGGDVLGNGNPDFIYDCDAILNLQDSIARYRQRYWAER